MLKPPDWHLCRIIAPSSRNTANQAHLVRDFTTQNPESSVCEWPNIGNLFLDKWSKAEDSIAKKYLVDRVSALKDELLENGHDMEKFERVLEEKGVPLFRRYPNGSAVVELLKQLAASPNLALQVKNLFPFSHFSNACINLLEYFLLYYIYIHDYAFL